MSDRPIPRALVQLARAVGAEAAAPDLAAAEWPAMLALAKRHRVEALLAAACADAPLPDRAIARQFAQSRLREQARAHRDEAALGQIADALQSTGVWFLVLKGSSVAKRYYATPADRSAVDIDVLVDPADIGAALGAVADLGFVQCSGEQKAPNAAQRAAAADVELLRRSDRAKLELHWRLSRNSLLPPWTVGALRRHAVELEIAARTLPVLAPPALLFHLVCHGARHLWFRLKWLADIDRVVRALDAAELGQAVRMAEDQDCARLFHSSLALSGQLFETPVAGVIDRCASHPGLLRTMRRALEDPHDVREQYGWRDLGAVFSNLRGRLLLRPNAGYRREALRHLLLDADDIAGARSIAHAASAKIRRKLNPRAPDGRVRSPR